MRIKFTGYVDFPDPRPDDRGSVDHWLVHTFMEAGLEDTDTAFEMLKLTWEEVSDAGDTNK
jgi:hypothetical protein